MMVNVLKLLEIFYISNMFEVSPRRLRNFWLDPAAAKTPDVQRVRITNAACLHKRKQALNSVATATLSVTSRHDDHDLSPKTLRPRAIFGLGKL